MKNTSSTRRRFIAVLAATTFTGCSGETADPSATEQPATNNSSPVSRLRSDVEDNSSISDSTPEDEDEPEPTVGWQINDPGQPQHVDDPNWRMHGHDTANSFRNPHAEGPSNNPSIQWTFDPATSVLAYHPTIVDGTVYACGAVTPTEESSEDQTYQLVAIDGETGEADTIVTHQDVIARPCVVESTVYVAIDGRVHAYDRVTGAKQWQTDDKLLFDPYTIRQVGDSLLATDGESWYFLNKEGATPQLYAINPDTGDVRWTAPGTGPNLRLASGLPLATDTVAVFEATRAAWRLTDGTRAGTLPQVADPKRRRWGERLFDDLLISVGSVTDGLVIAAHDWQTLEPHWHRKFPDLSDGPIMLNGVLWVPHMRTVLGLDPKTGKTQYRATLEMTPEDDHLDIQLIAGEDELYGVSLWGNGAFGVDPASGDVIWELQTESVSGMRMGAGGVAGDLLVANCGGKLFGIS